MDLYGDTTGTLLMKLKKEGGRDVDRFAEAMDALRDRQLKEGIFSFDCFTDKGSNAFSSMAVNLSEKS